MKKDFIRLPSLFLQSEEIIPMKSKAHSGKGFAKKAEFAEIIHLQERRSWWKARLSGNYEDKDTGKRFIPPK